MKEKMNVYPRVEVDLKKLRNNIDQSVGICHKEKISVVGVIKGFTGIKECIKQYDESDCDYIGTSRLEQIQTALDMGVKKPLMMIRVPMLSEVPYVVEMTDISLNSELVVLEALNKAATAKNKIHKIVLMADLGDLREGYWDKSELTEVAYYVENELKNLELVGVGTNLGCYGSVAATPEKMNELIKCAEDIEARIGRRLEMISGGATSSYPLVFKGEMPERINNLRLGEGIILARDLEDLYGYDMSNMHQDAFLLQAEIIELKEKPSYPVGKLAYDAFGQVGSYEDKGIRKKALLGLGRVDVAAPELLIPKEPGIEVMGASSDHLILDITGSEREFKVGDIITFYLNYATIVFATNSPNVKIVCK